jgi:hypothetical protein
MNKKNLKNCEKSRDSIYAVSTPCHLSRHCEVASCRTCEAIHSVPLLSIAIKKSVPQHALLNIYFMYFFTQSGIDAIKSLCDLKSLTNIAINNTGQALITATINIITSHITRFANIVSSLIIYITRHALNVTEELICQKQIQP